MRRPMRVLGSLMGLSSGSMRSSDDVRALCSVRERFGLPAV